MKIHSPRFILCHPEINASNSTIHQLNWFMETYISGQHNEDHDISFLSKLKHFALAYRGITEHFWIWVLWLEKKILNVTRPSFIEKKKTRTTEECNLILTKQKNFRRFLFSACLTPWPVRAIFFWVFMCIESMLYQSLSAITLKERQRSQMVHRESNLCIALTCLPRFT